MKNALVCIAKDEDNYIQEWIDYHFKIGFDKIFIYANDWNYSNVNKDVVVINITGKKQQVNAYNQFKKDFNCHFNWAAFWDVDEFLVLKKHKDIREFLSDYKDYNAIGINWAIFGNNDQDRVYNNDYSVLKRFTKRSEIAFYENRHIKTIVQLPCDNFQEVHFVKGKWFNLNNEEREGPYNEPIDWSVAQLNHYLTKSTEEFIEKCKKVRADNGEERDFKKYAIYIQQNFEEDLVARNFLWGKK